MSHERHAATRKFYDRISHAYDVIADAGEHEAREKGLEMLAAAPGEHVLEIGFGTGHSLVDLAQAVGPEGHVSGVDISQKMHDIAARKVDDAGLSDRVTLKVAAVPPLPFEDHHFDAAVMSFVLELFPLEEIPEVLADIARVLKPGGRLVVVSMATTREGEPDSVLERTYKWLHHHFPHIVDCQPIDVAGLVSAAGYENIDEFRMEIWTLPVAVVRGFVPVSR